MTKKTKEYVRGGMIVLIFILLTFILDLPKTSLIMLAVITFVVILMNEVFPVENKGGRKREYITGILFFAVFTVIILTFDLPKKLLIFMGILAVSNVLLYELLNIKNNHDS